MAGSDTVSGQEGAQRLKTFLGDVSDCDLAAFSQAEAQNCCQRVGAERDGSLRLRFALTANHGGDGTRSPVSACRQGATAIASPAMGQSGYANLAHLTPEPFWSRVSRAMI
ncbi:hypothetical protein C7B82_08835 [Stenomitos frigidus ULC18]|uniref:Uncharacterized protein n=1 Tax=Stenomitos frigidus ULC18 TaxID=2107698 RepID=A0A2T1ECV7_9CYAN|nr:hypothetical protein C7B82_08835 [Stenomitos frigidus ULC18]